MSLAVSSYPARDGLTEYLPPQYGLKLGRDQRDKFFTVYLGGDEERMKDIADAIEELTGMPFERL